MDVLRDENLFIDVTVTCGSMKYPAHRLVLAAHSPYFKAMFTSDMRESNKSNVKIENLDPKAVKKVLDYLYTSKIQFTSNTDDTTGILTVANYFVMKPLEILCCDELVKRVTPTRFLGTWQTFEKCGFVDAISSITTLLIQRMPDVVISEEFLKLSKDFLRKIIDVKFLADETLLDLVNWAKSDSSHRKDELDGLLRELNIPEISALVAMNLLQDPFCNQIPSLKKIIQSALFKNFWKRTAKTLVLKFQKGAVTYQTFDYITKIWSETVNVLIPQLEKFDVFHVFCYNNLIFFITRSSLQCLNVETNKCNIYPKFPSDFLITSTARGICVDSFIYIVDHQLMTRIEMQPLKTEEWKVLTSPKTECEFHIAELDGSIYVVNEKFRIFKYEIEGDLWQAEKCNPPEEIVAQKRPFIIQIIEKCICIFVDGYGGTWSLYVYKNIGEFSECWKIVFEKKILCSIGSSVKSVFYNSDENTINLCTTSGFIKIVPFCCCVLSSNVVTSEPKSLCSSVCANTLCSTPTSSAAAPNPFCPIMESSINNPASFSYLPSINLHSSISVDFAVNAYKI